jgi:NTP pyrophosphatase (non-canonical NTP hydrolase)
MSDTLLPVMPQSRYDVICDLLKERERQNRKFPAQSHHAAVWLAILTEEVGEASEAMLHDMFGGSHAGTFEEEMRHVAAVAMGILEAIKEGRCWLERPISESQANEQPVE